MSSLDPSFLTDTTISIDQRFATDIVHRLARVGYLSYFAGGCVRDALMGNAPNDFDVATNATVAQVAEVFGARNTLLIGESFGVACVHGRLDGQKCKVEVATFRSDGSYSDGRRPDWVTFTTPEADALRRDFTINGLFFDPIQQRVIDYVDGQRDIEQRIIRAIGNPNERIAEDKLRMLRAIRFAARFDFALDDQTKQAITESAASIDLVSGERIAVEVSKILTHPRRAWAMQQLYETKLLQSLMPTLSDYWSADHHRERDLVLLERLSHHDATFASATALLLSNLVATANASSNELVERLKERWKLSNADADSILFSIRYADRFLHAHELPWSELQPLLIREHAVDAIRVASAIADAHSTSRGGIELCRERLQWPAEQLNPPPLVTGHDLIERGMKPGRNFATLLEHVRRKQLDGELMNKDQAIEWIAQQ